MHPMFPLGTVLFPGGALPLHVFEDRYRVMVRDCLAGTPEFGVVLIERGSEVGGGDVRSDIGTLARIVEAAELPDGRWAIGAIGLGRIRVLRWLVDDPYPRAEIEPWPDPPSEPALAHRLPAVVALLRRALALRAEIGERAAPATLELSDDPALASYQAAAAAPLGPLDRQRLLGAPTVGARLDLLAGLLREEVEALEAHVARG